MRKNEIIKQIETLGYSEYKNGIYTKTFYICADKEFHISLEFENDVLDSSGFRFTLYYGNVGNWMMLVEDHIRYDDVDNVILTLKELHKAVSKMLEKALMKINEIIMTGL